MLSVPIKVSVLGIGMSATVFHIPFVLSQPENFSLHSIFERKATPQKSVARDTYGEKVKVVTTLKEVLEDKEVNCVFVSTINDTHYEYAKAALEAGKHCVVEKPVCATSAEARELAALAKSKNLVLAVYQNRRWDADFLTVKKLIKEGAFGEIAEFQSNFDRFKLVPNAKVWKEAPLPGAGAAFDLGSHLIDQILSLFGKPTSVTGIVRNSRLIGDVSVPDSFQIHLHYPATADRALPILATARGSILSHLNPQNRFLINGTKASFVKFGVDVQEDQLKKDGSKAVESTTFGKEPEDLSGTLYTQEGSRTVTSETGNYGAWFSNVAEAIKKNDPSLLVVTPEQAALVIEIVEAAEKSSKEGKTVTL